MMLKKIIRPGEPGYRQCAITIMDTTDPDISFDGAGVSNWVYYFREQILPKWDPRGNPAAFAELIELILSIFSAIISSMLPPPLP